MSARADPRGGAAGARPYRDLKIQADSEMTSHAASGARVSRIFSPNSLFVLGGEQWGQIATTGSHDQLGPKLSAAVHPKESMTETIFC
jgi:hypothetical protein